MSACEKCWSDSQSSGDPPAKYRALIESRVGDMKCSPEEQAGPDATECPACRRRTRHQVTGECMLCHAWPSREVLADQIDETDIAFERGYEGDV